MKDVQYALTITSAVFEKFLDRLQKTEPIWEGKKNWEKGGCFIYAKALQILLESHSYATKIATVYDTWNEDPAHIILEIGPNQYIDGETIKTKEVLLTEWENEFDGGCLITNEITEEHIKNSGIPVDYDLSLEMAQALEREIRYHDGIISHAKIAALCGAAWRDNHVFLDKTARNGAHGAIIKALHMEHSRDFILALGYALEGKCYLCGETALRRAKNGTIVCSECLECLERKGA